MLRQLLALSNNQLVFLSGDIVRPPPLAHAQGTRLLSKLAVSRNPYISTHGSFSIPTNLHALDRFVTTHGGVVYSSPYLEGFIVTVARRVHCRTPCT